MSGKSGQPLSIGRLEQRRPEFTGAHLEPVFVAATFAAKEKFMTASHPSVQRDDAALKRERTLSMTAGALGILMFVWGFLRWFNVGDQAHHQSRYSGYAFQTPSTAVVGFSLAAGLMAALGAMERRRGRGVPSAIPTALAATSLLLAIAVALGKGEISPTFGSKVGLEIGIYLAIATAALQTILLAMGLASRHDDRDDDYATDTAQTTARTANR
jgi:hypothetical protein